MTLLDLFAKEIEKAGKSLTIHEALNMVEEDGSFSTIEKVGKTPQNTINALLHKDIKRAAPRFIQVSNKSAKFDIKR